MPEMRAGSPNWRSPLRLAGRVVGGGVLLVILGGMGLLAVSSRLGYQNLFVRSGSMTGFASIGSLVVAQPLQASDVEVGDVILLHRQHEGRPMAPVLHRVIERSVGEDGAITVRTKGDANPDPDPEPYPLPSSTITPVLVVPGLGYVLATLRSPAGWLGLIVLPAVLLLSVVLVRLWSPDDEKDPGTGSNPGVQGRG